MKGSLYLINHNIVVCFVKQGCIIPFFIENKFEVILLETELIAIRKRET